MALCCQLETPIEREARLAASLLKSDPVPIWWHRRRIRGPPSSLLDGDGGQPAPPANENSSPFPRTWSINYNGSREKSQLKSCATDESSVFSTSSQEHRLRRDAFGNCLKHPHVQLARKRRGRQVASRFSKMFSKQKSSVSSTDGQKEEWEIIHEMCPECENDHIAKLKAQYQHKPKAADDSTDLNAGLTHEPFAATLTLIDSHPQLAEGNLALRIRTDPILKEHTRHLSFAATGNDGNVFWKWKTPDGALDFVYPADSNGQMLSEVPMNNKGDTEYQVMERIIPISSIDHVSRGGDAWDVLRQSTGENDFGCSCDIKIHGYCDRLLRFDVVKFDARRINSTHQSSRLRYSFGWVDFSQFSVSGDETEVDAIGDNPGGCVGFEGYTTENVIAKLNSIVLWERKAQESSWANVIQSWNNWLEECMGLGVPTVVGADATETGASARADRYDVGSNNIM